MERIYDTRTHFYKNCANEQCPNQTGPWTGRIMYWIAVYCQDCQNEGLDKED